MKTIQISLVVIMTLLSVLLTGCDGWIEVTGKAFEWVDAPYGSQSMVFIANASRLKGSDNSTKKEATLERLLSYIPESVEVKPLHNADVKISQGKSLIKTLTSDEKGDFKDSWIAGAGRYTLNIHVSKDGYIDVSTKISHVVDDAHVIAVVLVKE